MKLFKKIPLFLLLLVLFFCLHGSVENYGYLDMIEVFRVGVIITLCIAILFFVSGYCSKNYLLSSLVVFFMTLWYLFFGAIQDSVKNIPILRSYTVMLPVLFLLTYLWMHWLKHNRPMQVKLVLYLNILFIIFCISDLVLLLNKRAVFNSKHNTVTMGFDTTKVKQTPNVYFLVFDEYAGYKSLQDSFAFSNDSLYDLLQQKEFKILPTFSNYDYTPFSMSSVFNMQYVDDNYDHDLLSQPDIQARFGEIRNAAVFSIFRYMGYQMENYSIFDIKDHPALSGSNPLFPIHSVLLTDKLLHKRMIKDLGWLLVTGKMQIPFIKEKVVYRDDHYNKKAEEMVLRSAIKKTLVPKFCYGHFFLPHGMYFRNSNGAYNTIEQMQDLFNKDLYLSYLKYTNKVISKLVTEITIKDPRSIIILMSDHGFYNFNSPGDDDPYNYDNICLVRFPDKNYLPYKDKWSNVNFFRYLFNCEFGQNLPYLKDSSIYVHE